MRRTVKESYFKKSQDVLRYIFGGIMILGSLTDLPKFHGFIGIVFGVSLLPIVYNKIKKVKRKSVNFRRWKTIQIIVPIILLLAFAISLPNIQKNPSDTISPNVKKEYVVTFNTDGGNKIEKQNIKSGDKAEKPETPVKESYIFVEWQLNGKKFSFNSEITKNITLIATWEKIKTCNGTTITTDCELDGIIYSLYKYHPTVPEKSHIEKETVYKQKITGYCTLCNDGTRSPTCATGKGACSKHGGVRQFNAPYYSNIPETIERKVIDSPEVSEWYEKVVK